MTFAQRFTLVVLAAFFLSSVLTSIAGFAVADRMIRASLRSRAAVRAWTLAFYRLLPSAAALAITAFTLAPGYYRHEQRAELEGVGLVLAVCAAGGLLIVLASIVRAGRAVIGTSRLRRHWLAAGRPLALPGAGMPAFAIEAPFPLVAVLGVLRPRLFISTAVLDTCSAAELAAIVEHERRHVSASDNAMRLLMDAAPDALGVTGASAALAGAWHHAAEHRADDAARGRLDLASALVRVARLAGEARPVVLPASALYRGEGVEERVRRLVGAACETTSRVPLRALSAAAAAFAVAIALSAVSSRAAEIAHALLEAAVSLP